jgi:hypothetical protein
MTKLILTSAALLALALSSTASARPTARWLDFPTCAATTTTLTCTGRAGGLRRPNKDVLVEPVAAIFGEVHYTCSDPVFTILPEFPYWNLAWSAYRNRQTFSMEFTPAPTPSSLRALFNCFGTWTRDPNYYNVRVAVGWGLNPDDFEVTALEARLGTVAAQ